MNILIVGAGAVGSYLGGSLIEAGHDVTLAVRGQASFAIEKNGLTINERQDTYFCHPKVFNSLRQAIAGDIDYDVVFITVKAYDAEAVLNEIMAFYADISMVVTLQNGVGIEEQFVRELGSDRVIAGSLTTPVSHETYHSVRVERSDRGLALAPINRRSDISRWVEMFDNSRVDCVLIDDYQEMKWSKAFVNMIGNATSAILNRHPGLIYKFRPTYSLEKEMLRETLAVMKAQDLDPVDLPGVAIKRLVRSIKAMPDALLQPALSRIVAGGRGNKMPSFHIDLTAGKSGNEVTYHNGAVARQGERLGIATPVNTALYDILMKLVTKKLDYHIYDGHPKELVAAVDAYR